MNRRQDQFDSFYDKRGDSLQQPYVQGQLWDRLTQPTIVVSLVLIVGTFIFNAASPNAGIGGLVAAAAQVLWDLCVRVVPLPLLRLLDQSPAPHTSMSEKTQQTSHAAKSEMMRRVLRLDHASGMMASVFAARTRALSATGSALGFKAQVDRPAGLGNRDNSCYQNSILQGLASLRPLPGYLARCIQGLDAGEGDGAVAQTLRTLVSDLNDVDNNGATLWTPNLLKSMSSWTQQDAQEYYSKILDDIDKAAAKTAASARKRVGFEADDPKDDTSESQCSGDSGYLSQSSSGPSASDKMRNPLEGLLAQRVSCSRCSYSEGLSLIPFNCLTLSLSLDKQQHDLYERLDSFSHVEFIERVICPKCTLLKAKALLSTLVKRVSATEGVETQLAELNSRLAAVELALEEDDFDDKTLNEKCKIPASGKVSTTKTKQIVIARPPQSLAIHMQRSVFDPVTFHMMKNSAPVAFPMTLDLGPWCLGSASHQPIKIETAQTPTPVDSTVSGKIESNGDESKPDAKDAQGQADEEGEEQWISNPTASMIAGDLRPSRFTGPIYELRAAVTHYGRHENGHYVCYRQHPAGNKSSGKSGSSAEDGEPGDDNVSEVATNGENAEKDAKSSEGETDAKTERPQWWRLSDHNVSVVDESTVMSLSPGVFMLFYDCVDPTSVLAANEPASSTVPTSEPETDAETDANMRETPPTPGETDVLQKSP